MGWHWGILASSGGAAGAFDLLETTVLSSSQSEIVFSNIPQNYKHLQVRYLLRSDAATTNLGNIGLTFNSDTGNNYSTHTLNGTGSSVTSSAETSAARINIRDTIAGNSNTSGIFGSGVIDILDYSATTKNSTIRALAGGLGVETDILLASGAWYNTNAITSLRIVDLSAANFVAGSRVSIYGQA